MERAGKNCSIWWNSKDWILRIFEGWMDSWHHLDFQDHSEFWLVNCSIICILGEFSGIWPTRTWGLIVQYDFYRKIKITPYCTPKYWIFYLGRVGTEWLLQTARTHATSNCFLCQNDRQHNAITLGHLVKRCCSFSKPWWKNICTHQKEA